MPLFLRRLCLALTLLLAGAAALVVALSGRGPAGQVAAREPSTRSRLTRAQIPFDGQRAYGYLKQICELGPRISGSPGMQNQQALVAGHFEKLGAQVSLQPFRARDPRSGDLVGMANLIAEWHPERKRRILLCAHYDTRPLPDRDPDRRLRREGVFLGANDGASGVALLMELGRHMPKLESSYGVDFVLFDAEEFVYSERDRYFLGSEWFARQYTTKPPGHTYRWGVLLDMIGDADLQIYHERNSVEWPETRPLVADIWATAARLGVREFVARRKYEIKDDHLMLYNVGRIPTCVLIDFDYRPWHTTGDTPQRCSALSLAKVGWVVHEWLKQVK